MYVEIIKINISCMVIKSAMIRYIYYIKYTKKFDCINDVKLSMINTLYSKKIMIFDPGKYARMGYFLTNADGL